MKRLMTRNTNWYGASLLALSSLACNVETTETEDKPVKLPDATEEPGDAGTDGDAGTEPPVPAARGFVVVHSDYVSTQISVIDLDGEVLSASLISSSSESSGLSTALSGDVVLPTPGATGQEITLLDRSFTHGGVLTWVGLETAEVSRQLEVGDGFVANPYDYVEIASDKAFVVRNGTNAAPTGDLDRGGDLLIIDPSVPEITGSIDLVELLEDDAETLSPNPSTAMVAGGRLYVSLSVIASDFSAYGRSRLVTIDPENDEVLGVTEVDALRNCGGFSVSPDGKLLALSCSGDYTTDQLGTSGVALFDLEGDVPELVEELFAEDSFGATAGSLAFSGPRSLLVSTPGSFDADFNPVSGDVLFRLDLDTNQAEATSIRTEGPYNLGGLRCDVAARRCAITDAETEAGSVHVLRLDAAGSITRVSRIEIPGSVGLPPRGLGGF